MYDSQKYDSAFIQFSELAHKGDVESQNYLGWMYLNGFGLTRKDTVMALVWFKESADRKDSYGQVSLGIAHYYGYYFGKIIDYKKALELFKKSAEQNNSNAQYWMGWMYENGYGVTSKNSDSAFHYYQMSAHQNLADGQYSLGRMYEFDMWKKNMAKARIWYQAAAKQGHKEAEEHLKSIEAEQFFDNPKTERRPDDAIIKK